MTFTNMATFPVTLAVRWLDRVSGRVDTASDADMRVPAWPINTLFDAALRVEWLLLHVTNLPVGTSLICVAEKPTAQELSPRSSRSHHES